MKEFIINVDFNTGEILLPEKITIRAGDYNSHKLKFEFDKDYSNYIKVFNMQRTYSEETYSAEIINNELVLVNYDTDNNMVSLFQDDGIYEFNISLYGNDSKLTTTKNCKINVVNNFNGVEITPTEINIIDNLINDVNTKINEVDNINISVNDKTISITDKTGEVSSITIRDGIDGQDGQDGATGPQGEVGPKGDRGDTGPQGPQGIQGPQGEVGPKGDKGDTGLPGTNGRDGLNGRDGVDGVSPTKGTDYFTESDKQELVNDLLGTQTFTDLEGRVEDLEARPTGLTDEERQEFEDLKNNQLVGNESGTDLHITDSASARIKGVSVLGNTSQGDNPTPDNPQEINVVTGNNVVNITNGEYQELEYIESSGNQYIDVGLKANQNTNIELKYQFLDAWYQQANPILGSRNSNQSQNFSLWVNYSSRNSAFVYGTSDSGYIDNTNATDNPVTVRNEGNKFYYNDTLVYTATQNNFQTPGNIYLIGLSNENGLDNRHPFLKIYRFKLWQDGLLTRDMIPCYRLSDNVIGLYDIVNDVFYTNNGTGTFIAGPEVINTHIPQYQNYSLSLGDIELAQVGDAGDSITYEDGKWYLNKQVGKVVLNGSENWAIEGLESDGSDYYYCSPKYSIFEDSPGYKNIISTHYQKNIISNNTTNEGINIFWTNIRVRYGPKKTVEEWKSYLQQLYSNGNPLTVYAELATPTKTEITDTTLIEQLDNLAKARTYKNTTRITTETDNEKPILNVDYIQDLQSVINNLTQMILN